MKVGNKAMEPWCLDAKYQSAGLRHNDADHGVMEIERSAIRDNVGHIKAQPDQHTKMALRGGLTLVDQISGVLKTGCRTQSGLLDPEEVDPFIFHHSE